MHPKHLVRVILKHLPAFEAAVRHGSFTVAGDELGLTQSAISRQIKELENQLGCSLFIRSHRQIVPSPTGKKLFDAYAYAAKNLTDVVGDIVRPNSSNQIVLATSTSIATFWLMPRLAEMRQCFPGAEIMLVTSDPGGFDVAPSITGSLVFGQPSFAGFNVRRLFRDVLSPVCTPQFLKSHGPIESPADLLESDLLHMEAQHPSWQGWRRWFRRFDIEAPPRENNLGFNNYVNVIQACLSGQGVALGWLHLIKDRIDDGSLVMPLADRVDTEENYYLAVRSDNQTDWDPSAFSEWLMREFSTTA